MLSSMTDPAEATDVLVVGAGPIGLELAVALKQAGVDYVQVEAGPVGSTIAWWAPETRYFSSPERLEIAGAPLVTSDQSKATREQYLAYLRGVVRQFDLAVRTYRRVVRIERVAGGDGPVFRVRTVASSHGVGGREESGEIARTETLDPDASVRTISTRRIVLAMGNMHRSRRLDVPGEDLPHVSHYLGEPHLYFGRRLLVVGGKNSAVEAALRCYRCGARVSLSYRGEQFDPTRVKYWLHPEVQWLIEKQRIAWYPRTVPAAIRPGAVTLARTGGGGDAIDVPADFVLLLTGYVQDPDLFEQAGVELRGEARSPAVDRETMETTVAGVFVAGTAAGGTQRRARYFIENTHVHVARILRAITGRIPSWPCDVDYAAFEEA